jgi:hypothetical protein
LTEGAERDERRKDNRRPKATSADGGRRPENWKRDEKKKRQQSRRTAMETIGGSFILAELNSGSWRGDFRPANKRDNNSTVS